MKVVVTDYSFESLDIERAILERLGARVEAHVKSEASELPQRVADADAVITQFAPLTASVIGAMRRAKVIVRYGIGVDNVDLDAARSRHIPVCNVPDYCIDEVADHTLAFILAATRQVVANCLAVQAGQWKLAVPLSTMRALSDLTVGVVGFGRIGREVVRRLMAFKCRVLVFDPVVSPADIERAGCTTAGLTDLFAASDVVTLHCPSTAATRRMLNPQTLGQMKAGAILINVSRGDLVETDALIEALQQNRLSAVALDVHNPEPVPPDSPLLRMANVVISAHIASTSLKAAKKLRETAAILTARALQGEPLVNVVNGVETGTPKR